MKKVCIIGFGGIAQSVHRNGYKKLEEQGKAKLVAVCDIDPARFEGGVAINISDGNNDASKDLKTYTDMDEMLKNEQPDMVDICVPTFLHEEITTHVLELGYDTLCEKPMSLKYENCLRMIDAANKAGKQLMIGQCVRFFPEYAYLKEIIDNGTYGKPLAASFRRLSPPPMWGWDNWFMDAARSGGAALDLHIHDLDFVRYAFGEPNAVSCTGADVYSGGLDIAHTTYYYDDFTVSIQGDWSLKDVPFKADFLVSFEKATVGITDGKLTVYPRESEAFTPELSNVDGYTAEISYFIDVLNGETENMKNRPESAALSVKVVEKLYESAAKGGEKVAF